MTLGTGFDDIPEYIVDTDAVKPEEWDEDADGIWEPPKIKNPDFKGIAFDVD